MKHVQKDGTDIYLIQRPYDSTNLGAVLEAIGSLEQNELSTQITSPFTLVVVVKAQKTVYIVTDLHGQLQLLMSDSAITFEPLASKCSFIQPGITVVSA